jgi:hypothetical protein
MKNFAQLVVAASNWRFTGGPGVLSRRLRAPLDFPSTALNPATVQADQHV